MRIILYDASGHDRDLDAIPDPLPEPDCDQLLWVIADFAEAEALPDFMRAASRWRDRALDLAVGEAQYAFTVPVCPLYGKPTECILRFAVGPSWVLTLFEQHPEFLAEYIAEDVGETVYGRLTSSALTASLLLRHFTQFRQEIAAVETAIDQLDGDILRTRERRPPLATLAVLRRRIAGIRAALLKHRPVIHGMSGADFLGQLSAEDAAHFRFLHRAFERLEDETMRARDTAISSFELYSTRIAQDTNQLIRILTVFTAGIGLIGAVAGLFGMNFDTPFIHTGLAGFLIVSLGAIAGAAGLVGLAVWRRWL